MAISITLNGKAHELPDAMTVGRLLHDIGWEGKPVVVELNQKPVFARDYDKTRVEKDAQVEIIALAAGG